MANTTNFGWETPDDTDLVKDGALAMRTLGNAIDTSLVDLKGGTTGQILAKNTNTDMDFVWITNDQGDITAVTAGTGISGGGTTGAVTITNSMATAIDAKGDLIVGTGADTFSRLAVGTNGHYLVADSGETTGLKWAAPASPSFVGAQAGLGAGGQSISYTQNVETVISFNSENFDTDGFHSTSTNTSRMTIPTGKGGYYLFTGTLFLNTVPGYARLTLRKNGTFIREVLSYGGRIGAYLGNGNEPVIGNMVTSAAAGDYFELAFQSDVATGTYTSYGTFTLSYLGA